MQSDGFQMNGLSCLYSDIANRGILITIGCINENTVRSLLEGPLP